MTTTGDDMSIQQNVKIRCLTLSYLQGILRRPRLKGVVVGECETIDDGIF